MCRFLIGCSAAALAISAGVTPASGHHSYAEYDRCERVTIVGEIADIVWANPHILITVDSAEAGRYRIEWFDLGQLPRAGVGTRPLSAGDHVAITGSRHRDPQVKIMTLLTGIRRPSDGWTWSIDSSRRRACD